MYKKLFHPLVIAFLCLAITEFILVLPTIQKVGFYLDDWSMLSNLHFGPNNLISAIIHYLNDSRILIRPLEAPYFATLFQIFGDHPFGYHLINAICELLSSWFLYLYLARLSNSKAISLAAALVFLVFPSHDATHYWITASSATLSIALYLSSLWLNVKAIQEKNHFCLGLSAVILLLSLFNYESFLPLVGLNVISSFIALGNMPIKQRLISTIGYMLPYIAACALLYAYQRVFLIAIGMGYNRAVALDPGNFINVIYQGILMNFSVPTLSFYAQQANELIQEKLSRQEIWLLAISVCLTALSLFALLKKENINLLSTARLFCLLGIMIMVISYTIFGVVPGYMPLLNSIMNRINYGASIGASLFIVGIFAFITEFISICLKNKSANFLMIPLTIILLCFFNITNWNLAKPWIVSWAVQQHVINLVKANAENINTGDSVILGNTPRYVLWSPLFDGVWDFQAMLQMKLNDRNIKAGVVSDRMQVEKNNVKDISCGYLCGTYPFKRMFILFPSPAQWIAIHSSDEFVETIKKLGTGVESSTIGRWQKQLQE